MQRRSFLGYLPYLFLLAAVLALLVMNPSSSSAHTLSYTELQSTLKNEDVTEAVLRIGTNAVNVQGTYVDDDGNTVTFTSTAPATEESIQDLTDRLEDGRLTIVDAESGNAFMQAMYELVPLVIVLLLGVWMMNRMGGNNSANAKAFDFGKSRARLETKSKVRFSDVAGCDEEKAEMEEIIGYLKSPAKYKRMGARIPKGILLCGHPGTGKTLLLYDLAKTLSKNGQTLLVHCGKLTAGQYKIRKEIERLLDMKDGVRSPENIFWIVCQLAATFKVSRSMAKYRMIELGYPEAEGVYAYIDNVRIPDYGCSGLWERGITYAISLADAGALLRESREFSCALQGGRYVYIEGHFCLNEETYVQRGYRQIQRLTAYARRHIEECCIAFTVQGRYANTAYEDAQAARKKEVKDKYQSRHGFGAEPESKERLKENKTFAEDSQIWMKLRMRMPDGIGSAIQLILDEKGITQMELAMRMGVSRTAWRKWCAEKMSLRHIVAICIALDVRADIGMELVRLAGHSFLNNKEHNILLAMMYETKDLTVARANEILRQEKLAPLTEGKDEEIAC